jgi:predicted short-subunit dehydrogenase-like oxidoreductase (DUF2520 family)
MKISLIGSGNVAWHLAQALDRAGQNVMEVYSKHLSNAEKLCEKLYNATPKKDVDFSYSKSEIFIIAVPDDALESIISQARFPINSFVVHTSGTQSLEILSKINHSNVGVFYPLQTFSKSKAVDFKKIPLCIEASNEKTEQTLEKLAFSICENVCFYNSDDRKVLHLAAVFACNFTNHLLTLSKEIVEQEGLSFDVLKPLINETFEKALQLNPESVQTGPAARKDIKTITKHLEMLQSNSISKQIYSSITESILDRNYSK